MTKHFDHVMLHHPLVVEARDYARVAHGDQKRKYTGAPYTDHLHEVACILLAHVPDAEPEMVAAAYLHDTVEDTAVRPVDILFTFGPTVGAYVDALTDVPAQDGMNRRERKKRDQLRLKTAAYQAQAIKLADLASNTASISAHDAGFAKVYLPEKLAMLGAISGAVDVYPALWAHTVGTLAQAVAAHPEVRAWEVLEGMSYMLAGISPRPGALD